MLKNKLVIEIELKENKRASTVIKGDRRVCWSKVVKELYPTIMESLEEKDDESEKSSEKACIESLADIADKSYDDIVEELKSMDGGLCPENIGLLCVKYINKYMLNKTDKKKH